MKTILVVLTTAILVSLSYIFSYQETTPFENNKLVEQVADQPNQLWGQSSEHSDHCFHDEEGVETLPTNTVVIPQVEQVEDIPSAELREDLLRLDYALRKRTLDKLKQIPFHDLNSVRVNSKGNILYACKSPLSKAIKHAPVVKSAQTSYIVKSQPVMISQLPALSSRPSAPNTLYMCFVGGTVTGTDWNDGGNQVYIPLPYDRDGNSVTFNTDEQAFIVETWRRVADDFSAFNINVTTVPPTATQLASNRVAYAYVTQQKDANGNFLPYASSAGGVAWYDVYGTSTYSTKQSPVWVYNIWDVDTCAVSISHEVGHNLGLSHDGTTTSEYYFGHYAFGKELWSPIMGFGGGISQWSKGDYYGANNLEDDLFIISNKLSVFSDYDSVSPMAYSSGGYTATGTLESSKDIDEFQFKAFSNSISFDCNAVVGGNVDIKMALKDDTNRTLVVHENAVSQNATIGINNLTIGKTYTIVVSSSNGTGNPFSYPTTGYVGYGCIGAYTLQQTGNITVTPTPTPTPTPKPTPTPNLVPVVKSETIQAYAVRFRFLYGLTATNNPTQFQIVSGVLPAGLKLDPKTGIISGTPTVTGNFMFHVTATNKYGTSSRTLIAIKLWKWTGN